MSDFNQPFTQEGDVFVYQTPDGGNVTAVDGFLQMTGGLPTAVYLSCFGGNYEDDGRKDNDASWWGNALEVDPVSQYRSETQYFMDKLSPIPASLGRIEDAAKRDLKWLLDRAIASSVTVVATMPALNRIKLAIVVQADGEEHNFNFVENWRAGGFEPIITPLAPVWRVLESHLPRLTENGEFLILEP